MEHVCVCVYLFTRLNCIHLFKVKKEFIRVMNENNIWEWNKERGFSSTLKLSQWIFSLKHYCFCMQNCIIIYNHLNIAIEMYFFPIQFAWLNTANFQYVGSKFWMKRKVHSMNQHKLKDYIYYYCRAFFRVFAYNFHVDMDLCFFKRRCSQLNYIWISINSSFQ